MLSILTKKLSIAKSLVPVISAGYHENVVSRFENPTNVGSLDKNKETVGTGKKSKLLLTPSLFGCREHHLFITFLEQIKPSAKKNLSFWCAILLYHRSCWPSCMWWYHEAPDRSRWGRKDHQKGSFQGKNKENFWGNKIFNKDVCDQNICEWFFEAECEY